MRGLITETGLAGQIAAAPAEGGVKKVAVRWHKSEICKNRGVGFPLSCGGKTWCVRSVKNRVFFEGVGFVGGHEVVLGPKNGGSKKRVRVLITEGVQKRGSRCHKSGGRGSLKGQKWRSTMRCKPLGCGRNWGSKSEVPKWTDQP